MKRSAAIIRSCLPGVLLCLLAVPSFADTSVSELPSTDQMTVEIEHLLSFIGNSGCDFMRNGGKHSAKDAESHLRMKYRRGSRYVSSADEFVTRIASKSSWSGTPYEVDCPDQPAQPAGPWLHQALTELRESPNS